MITRITYGSNKQANKETNATCFNRFFTASDDFRLVTVDGQASSIDESIGSSTNVPWGCDAVKQSHMLIRFAGKELVGCCVSPTRKVTLPDASSNETVRTVSDRSMFRYQAAIALRIRSVVAPKSTASERTKSTSTMSTGCSSFKVSMSS